MLVEDIKAYCLSKNKAYEEHPFGDVPICCKLNGKIFAQIYPYEDDYKSHLNVPQMQVNSIAWYIRGR